MVELTTESALRAGEERGERLGAAIRKAAWLSTATLALVFALPAAAEQLQTAPAAADKASASAGSAADAATGDIVVTAERRSEGLQKIPMAISAYSADTLRSAGVQGISSLQHISPSVQFGEGQNNVFISIRGIGSELPNIGSESGVAISNDGVTLSNRYMFDADFLDVERVEVLRGPQGTIAGRNATGGAINIISRRPTSDFAANITGTVGNYDRVTLEGFVSGPVAGDWLKARVAFRRDYADGWLHDVTNDRRLNNTRKEQGRISLLADVSSNLTASLILEGSRDRSLVAPGVDAGRVRSDTPSVSEYYNIPPTDLDDLRVNLNTPINTNNVKRRYQATFGLSWKLGPNATLTSTTGYVHFFNRFAGDFDGSQADIAAVPDYYAKGWQVSQELTLAANLTDRVDLILGGLYLDTGATSRIQIGFPQIGAPAGAFNFLAKQDLKSYGIYSQLRWRVTDALRISAGGRYTHDKKTYAETDLIFGGPVPVGGSPADGSWAAFTPRVSADLTLSPEINLFATVSRGFKSGGFNTFANPVDRFEPEHVWSYEAGVKAHSADNRLRATVTGFYMDYKDLQQSIFGLQAGSFLPQTLNAASATIKGIETELQAQISDRIRLTAAGTYLDAKYDKLRSHDALFPELGTLGPAGLNIRDASGNQLVRAPKFQTSVGGEYNVPITDRIKVVASANYSWQSRIYFDIFNHDLISQGAYGITTASIGLDGGAWRVTLAATNLFDKRYFNQEFTSTGIGPVATHLGGLGEPRMVRLSASFDF